MTTAFGAALLLVAFTLLRPGFWWDRIFPPLMEVPAAQLEDVIDEVDPAVIGKGRISV